MPRWRAVHRSGHRIRNPESLSFLFPIHTSLFFSCCRFQTYWRSTGGKHPCRGRKPKGGRAGKPKIPSSSSSCWGDRTQQQPGSFRAVTTGRVLLVLLHRTGFSLKPCSPCSPGRSSAGSVPCPGHRQVPVLLAHEGKVCSWNKDEAQVLMARVMVRTPRMLSTNPDLA